MQQKSLISAWKHPQLHAREAENQMIFRPLQDVKTHIPFIKKCQSVFQATLSS